MSKASMGQRLDVALVERQLASSRERAQSLVAAGMVEVEGTRARSAAQLVKPDAPIRLLGRDHPWVSRGGVKLDAALEAFGVDCRDRVALDAGASTGGFTQVLLSRGCRLVYAVDVGYGQLDSALAIDPRVVVMDRTNLRTLDVGLDPQPDVVTLDLSFISLRMVMEALIRVAPGAQVVALYKPQFELGRGAVGRGGVVRDREAVQQGLREFMAWLTRTLGAEVTHPPVASPIPGTKGNQEWFTGFRLPHVCDREGKK